jgi:F0F1-type ATP synthase assembly protein I
MNALGYFSAVVLVKRGYGRGVLKTRAVTTAVIVGVVIGYILGKLI